MSPAANEFLIDPNISFLNFGSFGACPKPVLKAYQDYQLEQENDPVHFIARLAPKYIESAKSALANFLRCESQDLVLITNPTYAVNIVAKNFPLAEGDEILTTDLEYGACDKTWMYYCQKAKAVYRRQKINLPIRNEDEVVEQIFEGFNSKTKLLFISHITSTTALYLPIDKIAEKAKTLGLPVFVDGAHAPAHIPLDLRTLDVDYYTGACHKWMMAPKGSSFFYVKKEKQNTLDPLIISWGYLPDQPTSSMFSDYHQMNGTRDLSAFAAIADALDFLVAQNWSKVSAQCKQMTAEQASEFHQILKSKPLDISQNANRLQMCSAEIYTPDVDELYQQLRYKYLIQIPVMRHGDKVYLRYSTQVFNSESDFKNLFAVLHQLKKAGLILPK